VARARSPSCRTAAEAHGAADEPGPLRSRDRAGAATQPTPARGVPAGSRHPRCAALDELGSLPERALTAPAPPFDQSWEREREISWQETLRRQVIDLRELEQSGDLADEQRYFGIDAPRGGRWYNFEVGSYLECGVEGAFGGWTPEENGGRVLVPGKVAVIDQAGQLVAVDPEELDEPACAIETVSWGASRLEVEAGAMHVRGHAFFLSDNGVWLVEAVPPEFIREPSLT
jgi:hypothetical protein